MPSLVRRGQPFSPATALKAVPREKALQRPTPHKSNAILAFSMGKRDALRDLIWNVPSVASALLSALSVLLTYLFLPPQYSWSRPWIILLVLVAGLMIAATRLLHHKDEEISRLRQEIADLSRRPYDLALADEARRMIAALPAEAPEVLRFVLERCPVSSHVIREYARPRGQAFEKAVFDTLVGGEKEGLLVRILTGPPADQKTSWDITNQFKAVLKDILYEQR